MLVLDVGGLTGLSEEAILQGAIERAICKLNQIINQSIEVQMSISNSLEFNFPSQLEQLRTVGSLQYLKEAIRELAMQQSLGQSGIRYRYLSQKNKYLYAKCYVKGCKACLKYKLDSDNFRLSNANIHHRHQAPQSKRLKFRMITEYIQSLPPSVSTSSLKKIVCSQFSINEKQFYYVNKLARFKQIEFDALVKELQTKGMEVYYSQEPREPYQPPQILVVVSQKMKDQFALYGQVVSFDLTFNLIKNNHKSRSRWKLGCFVATTAAKHVAPLALVLTLHETKEVYVQIFRTFFTAMGGQPRIIISDEEKAMHAALMQLKEKGQFGGRHMLDIFHILHNVKLKLKTKEHLYFFKKIAQSSNLAQFQYNLNIAKKQLDGKQLDILHRFVERSHLYCISKTQPNFIGLSSSSSKNECLHNLIKAIVPSQKDFNVTVKIVISYLQQLQNKSEVFDLDRMQYENILGVAEIKGLRLILTKPILSKLIQQIAKSIKSEIIEATEHLSYIKEYGHLFSLQTDQQKGLWKCNCGYLEKSGLPCRHLLRLLIVKQLSIISHLPQRWICMNNCLEAGPKNNGIMKARGRQRISRRRIF